MKTVDRTYDALAALVVLAILGLVLASAATGGCAEDAPIRIEQAHASVEVTQDYATVELYGELEVRDPVLSFLMGLVGLDATALFELRIDLATGALCVDGEVFGASLSELAPCEVDHE